MSEQLLPCPFCGGEAEMDSRRAYSALRPPHNLRHHVAIYCLSCEADMAEDPRENGVTEEDAIYAVTERWNRRPSPQQPAPASGYVSENFGRQDLQGPAVDAVENAQDADEIPAGVTEKQIAQIIAPLAWQSPDADDWLSLEKARVILALLPQAVQSDAGWRDIATEYPKQGQQVLAFCRFPAGKEVRACIYKNGLFWAYGIQQNVQFWQPFPAPPQGDRTALSQHSEGE